jgi:hypothetical protein
VVESAERGGIVYQAESRQPTECGYGRYGGPDTRPLRAFLAAAEAARFG